ncbi:MAG: SWIM zinc finger family protein [Dehalococcoidia bacterium]|nr:SWIM zinc finger family protein [Dehalococcoidia bacterium]
MVKKKALSWLTESHIAGLCSERSFERGRGYFEDGAIRCPVVSDGTLTAECEGSGDEGYEVVVHLGKGEIESASCTCPYDWGGYCKHIVALLLNWIRRPEDFVSTKDIRSRLEVMSQTDLIELVLQSAREDPRLLHTLCRQTEQDGAKQG